MANLTLSKRQYALLEIFVERITRLNIPGAQEYDQRPFGSLVHRRLIAYSPRYGGFHVTKEGRQVWQEFHHANIQRHDPSRPLTRYFDPTQFGLTDVYRQTRKLHVVKDSSAA